MSNLRARARLQIGVSRAMSALRPFSMEKELRAVHPVGINPGKIKLSPHL